MNEIEKKIEVQNLPQNSENSEKVLQSTIEVPENISKIVGENGGGAQNPAVQKQKTGFSFFDFASEISKLLFSSKPKKIVLPKYETQIKKIEKSIRKEEKNLLKMSEKLAGARNFSAAALEKVILQIRNLRRILREILSAGRERVEQLYKKFVLKIG